MKLNWLIFPVLCFAAGCTANYWNDRGNDAADIMTFTGGSAYGAATRVGPLHAGLGFYGEAWGLRGGALGEKGNLIVVNPIDKPENLFDKPAKNVRLLIGKTGEYTLGYKEDFLYGRTEEKNYITAGNPAFAFDGYPLLTGARALIKNKDEIPLILPYYTQIDAAGGFLGGIRVGMNPGELFDFMLGFTTLDIYGDDVESKHFVPNAETVVTLDTSMTRMKVSPDSGLRIVAIPSADSAVADSVPRH